MTVPFLNPDYSEELALRVKKVRAQMPTAHVDAVLVASSTNMFYMSGGIFRGYIYLDSNPDRSPLFLFISPSEAPDDSRCMQIHKPEHIANRLSESGYGSPARLGLEYGDMLCSDIERLKKCFPDSEFADASAVFRKARMTKTPYEIRAMERDGIHQAVAYSQVSHCYQEDMTDLELQIEIERVLRREGCLGFLRAAGSRMELNLGSVLNGDNADNPSPYDFAMGGEGIDPSLPVGANGMTMRRGTVVMVDMNGGFNGYQTDMTRCWALGDVPEPAHKAHDCSRAILRELERIGKPGVPISELYKRAVAMAEEAGLAAYFMGHRHKVRFIGHGVGIELNEMPVVMERNNDPLEENMTIALEPKFVIPHVGAVGVENTYQVTPEGLRNLTVFNEELSEL